MICNKALKITNKDIIYAQLDSGYSDNLELNLYLKFGDEERHVGNFSTSRLWFKLQMIWNWWS
ncbi:MAG: hypothetical protein OHM56_04265 [Spiroplasma phoeniceum]|nr:MAG: hypothetical protein OHM57_03665 [Spiroplasma phoeniceum]UZQ33163.1 MAG: hypothetical protein OHM56_04265 [Spiroplasma phoeniceum]